MKKAHIKISLTAIALTATTLAIAHSAEAQTREQFCQQTGRGITPVQQVACAAVTPQLRNVLDENLTLAGQIAARLDRGPASSNSGQAILSGSGPPG